MISDPGAVLLPSQRGALGLSICQPAQLQAFRIRVQDRLLVLPLRLQVGHRQVCLPDLSSIFRVEMSQHSQELKDTYEDSKEHSEEGPDEGGGEDNTGRSTPRLTPPHHHPPSLPRSPLSSPRSPLASSLHRSLLKQHSVPNVLRTDKEPEVRPKSSSEQKV